MKITMKNGITFEDTQAEYEELLAYAERKIAEDEEKEAQVEETIEFEGATYRKVEREAREGDVVIFHKSTRPWATNSRKYAVQKGPKFDDNDGDMQNIYNVLAGRTRETVDVYEPIEQAKYVPQEGDIVVVVKSENGSRNSVGDIGKVSNVSHVNFAVDVPQKPKAPRVNGNKHEAYEVRKATPAEVEKYEQAAHKASFAVGDYVKVVKSYADCEGEIVKITEIGEYDSPRGVCDFVVEHSPKKDGRFAVKAEQIVKATGAEIAKSKAPKLKAGDFVKFEKDGMDITAGKVYEVKADDDGDFYVLDDIGRKDYRAGRDSKYEIVDAETAKWAKIGRKPNEFKQGDVVRVVAHADGKCEGEIGLIEDAGILGEGGVGVRCGTHYVGICFKGETVELVAPVESLFNA